MWNPQMAQTILHYTMKYKHNVVMTHNPWYSRLQKWVLTG